MWQTGWLIKGKTKARYLDVPDEVNCFLIADHVPQAISGHDDGLIVPRQQLLVQVRRCHHIPATARELVRATALTVMLPDVTSES